MTSKKCGSKTASTVRRIHVIPVDDKDEFGMDFLHTATRDCPCQPLCEEPIGLFVHHAQDLREARERMTGKAVLGWTHVAEFVADAPSTRRKKSVRITVEVGTDPVLLSKDYKVPLKIYANDDLIFAWTPTPYPPNTMVHPTSK